MRSDANEALDDSLMSFFHFCILGLPHPVDGFNFNLNWVMFFNLIIFYFVFFCYYLIHASCDEFSFFYV